MSFCIVNSYETIRRTDMRTMIEGYRQLYPAEPALWRSTPSLVREWCAHNLLYRLGLFRSHTKDVDFEDRPSCFASLCWAALSLFYWH